MVIRFTEQISYKTYCNGARDLVQGKNSFLHTRSTCLKVRAGTNISTIYQRYQVAEVPLPPGTSIIPVPAVTVVAQNFEFEFGSYSLINRKQTTNAEYYHSREVI